MFNTNDDLPIFQHSKQNIKQVFIDTVSLIWYFWTPHECKIKKLNNLSNRKPKCKIWNVLKKWLFYQRVRLFSQITTCLHTTLSIHSHSLESKAAMLENVTRRTMCNTMNGSIDQYCLTMPTTSQQSRNNSHSPHRSPFSTPPGSLQGPAQKASLT